MQLIQSVITNPVEQTKAYIERDTYGFVNTKDILGVFENAGWTPVSTQFGRVRNTEKMGFQKHLIRLENPRYPSIEGLTNSNNSKPQLVLLNSHDGTSSLQILWGLIRVACMNGIIAGTGINGIRLTHSKSITDRLPTGIDYMLNNFDNFANQIKVLQGKVLTEAAILELIKTTYDARLSNVKNVTNVDYSLPRLQRMADKAIDAYTIFNRIQEALMRGGIKYEYEKRIIDNSSADLKGKVIGTQLVTTHTRRIASVPSQVKLNQLAYDTALSLAA